MIGWAKRLARQGVVQSMHARRAARNKRKDDSLTRIKRILVIRPDHLGDLLFATPALSLIRETFPQARITGAVGPWGRAMWAHNPDLDALVTIPFPGIAGGRQGGPLGPYHLLGKAADALAENQYDLGIALRYDHWWGAALLWAAGVPRRWGYDVPGMRAWLTDRVPYKPGRHEVEQSFRLAEAVVRGAGHWRGIPLTVDRERARPSLRPPVPLSMQGNIPRDWLKAGRRAIVHPGTGAANKLWTIEGWAEVIHQMRQDGWAVALTGSPGEGELAEAIVAAIEEHQTSEGQALTNLTGQTANLNELAWLFQQADVVLGVDSGPLHVAVSLDRPTLHLYGPSDERTWGPWGDPHRHRAIRAPGTRPTGKLEVGSDKLEGGSEMRAITPEMVMSELNAQIEHA